MEFVIRLYPGGRYFFERELSLLWNTGSSRKPSHHGTHLANQGPRGSSLRTRLARRPYFLLNIFMISEQKSFLRQEALKNRARMEIEHDNPDHVIDLFFGSVQPATDHVLSFYVPMYREFDCWSLIEAANERGFSCALPVIQKDERILKFARWTPDIEMEQGLFKIPQPVHHADDIVVPDIVVMPLLAFDRRGYRLGMGGGYYDATLSALRAEKENILAVGVAYSQQACLFNLPVEDHDQKLDWVITPQGTHYFGD